MKQLPQATAMTPIHSGIITGKLKGVIPATTPTGTAGAAVRWICIPLMVTMAVAAGTAHWENGWHVAPETELTAPWEWREDLIEDGVERRTRARALLRRHGNYDYLTEAGSITINKNGIEWAATYFVMLMALMALGAGKFLSVDYWLGRFFPQH